MPTFDIVSEVDMQEVRNAVDQANREAATRFDFKNTDSAIDLGENELVLRSSTEDRLRALHQVLDEKLVKRQVSLKAFEDAKVEGYKRAQHRFIGAGGSGKHGDPTVIPAGNFTLSVMYVNPGQGNAAHTHEVEECFFVLDGYLDVFVEDESGKRITTRLGPWECIACPACVIHGYQNDSLEPVYFQVMLGRGKPEAMGYADDDLFKRREAHLKAV